MTNVNILPGTDANPVRFYGKYRGTVTDNDELDPLMRSLHRIQVSVPQVPSADNSWALPCFPYAGEDVGFYTVPPVGASVWVEFEGGNPNYPIWTGCFWDEAEFIKPSEENPLDPAMAKMIITENTELILNDTDAEGHIKLSISDPAVEVPVTMTFNALGATIETGSSSLKMTPEGIITLTASDSTITMSEEGITMTGPVITGEAEGDISMTAGEAMTLAATEGAVDVTAGAAVAIDAVAEVDITAGAAVTIDATAEVDLTAGAAATIDAAAAVDITAGAAVAIDAVGDVDLTAAAVTINALADVEIAAAAAMQLNAIGNIEAAAITMAITGVVEVTGDLLIDGQQPLVV